MDYRDVLNKLSQTFTTPNIKKPDNKESAKIVQQNNPGQVRAVYGIPTPDEPVKLIIDDPSETRLVYAAPTPKPIEEFNPGPALVYAAPTPIPIEEEIVPAPSLVYAAPTPPEPPKDEPITPTPVPPQPQPTPQPEPKKPNPIADFIVEILNRVTSQNENAVMKFLKMITETLIDTTKK